MENLATPILLIFIILVLKEFLKPQRKNNRNYRKKTNKMTEKQKLTYFGIFFFIILLIIFPKFTIILIAIATIIGIMFLIAKSTEEENNIIRTKTKYTNSFRHKQTIYEKQKQAQKDELQREEKRANYQQQTHSNMYDTIKKTKQTKSNIQKGKEYEEQIGKYYESIGYHVVYHGLEKGKKDKGIDLIATRDNETILIQCKNWEKSLVQQKHLKEFLWNCDDFIKNNTFQTLHVKRYFITSNEKMDYGVKKFMQEQYKNLEYKIVEYDDL